MITTSHCLFLYIYIYCLFLPTNFPTVSEKTLIFSRSKTMAENARHSAIRENRRDEPARRSKLTFTK